jgi:DNA invertase Pin-like site-specific DNA recombinase
MKPAIGYIRVSTARQGRSGLGLEAQQAALGKFCDAEAFKLLETYTETESGADDDRPQLSAAIERARRPSSPSSWRSSTGYRATCTTSAA